eukprot:COSAG01_NODE_10135_length_2240_cov_377.553947_4_plen_124_part_00
MGPPRAQWAPIGTHWRVTTVTQAVDELSLTLVLGACSVVRTHLGHLSDPAEIVGFGCTRIAAGRQAEIYWDLRRKWPQICRNSAEPAEKTYAHTHLGHPCTTANQRIRLRSPHAVGGALAFIR